VKRNDSNVVDIGSAGRAKLNDEVDQLFQLPLAEFTDARNALAKRLKANGRANDADLVKTLTKPSVSAWTVNQLYWQHRDAFDELLAAGQRVRQAQASGTASKLAEMRQALDARRESLVQLSDLASSLLSDAGHNPSPDTIRRITTTLEAVSAISDGPTLGRLTQDVDPPGFESLAAFMAGTGTAKATAKPARATASQTAAKSQPDKAAVRAAQRQEEMRQAMIAAAKLSLQKAKKSLLEARGTAQTLATAHKKALGEAKQAEKQLREAEERLKKASAAAEAASERAQSIADEAEEAANTVADAEEAVAEAAKELETLFGER
jgi:hypothetical protein